MPLLDKPHCPNCRSDRVTPERSLRNSARLALATTLGIFLGDTIKIWWVCADCKHHFLHLGGSEQTSP